MSIKDLKNMNKQDLLSPFGLEPRRTTAEIMLPAMGLFGAGVLLGAGLGLLFAPTRGKELRREIAEKARAPLGRGADAREPAEASA